MITVGFCNLKGGVGKTTACQNLAVGLTRMGKRVGVVDMDPQSNLSLSFGIESTVNQPNAFDLLSGAARWNDVLVRREGVDIAPSSLDLVMVELRPEGRLGRDTLLKEVVSQIDNDRYDFLFFDSPPQLGIFTRNVLSASDKLIVPIDGGFYSLSGLRLLYNALPLFKERLNPDLSFLGILLTRHSPNVFIHREIAAEIRGFFGALLFDSYIRQNVSLVEASSLGISVFSYDTSSNGAHDYEKVTSEFLKRCEANG